MRKIKICFVVTNEFAFNNFLVNHVEYLNSTEIYSIHVILNSNNISELSTKFPFVNFIFLNIRRKPSIFFDTISLVKIIHIFSVFRFDIIHSLMPKTGLLSMVASYILKINIRIHTFTGQVWANKKGLTRQFLLNFDKLIASCSTNTLADSYSQIEFLIEQGVVNKTKSQVIANGSICGVDIHRFSLDKTKKTQFRLKYNFTETDVVFLYMGRLNKEKGILDLINAFDLISVNHNYKLLIVGPDEMNISENKSITNNKNIIYINYTNSPEDFYNISDIICIPSYREGFGNVVIEAGLYSIPSIGSDIYGLKDSIIDGFTGLSFKCGNILDLSIKMKYLAENLNLRFELGNNARDRSLKLFDSRIIIKELNQFYINLFKHKVL